MLRKLRTSVSNIFHLQTAFCLIRLWLKKGLTGLSLQANENETNDKQFATRLIKELHKPEEYLKAKGTILPLSHQSQFIYF